MCSPCRREALRIVTGSHHADLTIVDLKSEETITNKWIASRAARALDLEDDPTEIVEGRRARVRRGRRSQATSHVEPALGPELGPNLSKRQ